VRRAPFWRHFHIKKRSFAKTGLGQAQGNAEKEAFPAGPAPLPGNVGRFRREWTKATVEMDCSVGKYGKATITMKQKNNPQ
jgi:hypothetical protein